MKTEISNFFVLVSIFCWVGFCFSVFCQKTENRKFFKNFKSDQKMLTNTRKSAKKHPESHLGLFSNDLTVNRKTCRFLPGSACRAERPRITHWGSWYPDDRRDETRVRHCGTALIGGRARARASEKPGPFPLYTTRGPLSF